VKEPSDHPQRRRFAEEIERNFSVMAAAGSGKTHAITERIVQIARSPKAEDILPRLAVVTFTHRAADEMQQRTRQRILQEVRGSQIQIAFNRAFFGTIHSFCMKLLTNYGHYLGLPATLDLITDDEDLWEEFVQQQLHVGRNLSDENRTTLFQLAQARQLMELGRNARTILSAREISQCPTPDFTQVLAVVAKGSAIKTVADSQDELREFEKRRRDGWDFVRWPVRSSSAQNFLRAWTDAFSPLRKWVTDAAMCIAAEVQRDYRNFRLARGVVTYADQVALADELIQHPIAGRRIREENLRVILDEAQDTDPTQFSVLTEIARPPEANGRWLETKTDPPLPGHFCMVGDRQQSIYHDRADLENYLAIHEALVEQCGEALEFAVTFRLDKEQLEFVNETFRDIFNGESGQVKFIKLQFRPDVLPGQVVRVSLGKNLLPDGKSKDYRKAKLAAAALAKWIKDTGYENLRADSWRDVAILCPRKAWLRTMAIELRKVGVPVAIQSESDLKGDHPAHAWLTALCTIMSDPLNGYEVVGVLREVFGISDHDLALFSEGDGARFRIDQPATIAGVVGTPLKLLAGTRVAMSNRALFDAVKILVEQTKLRERLAILPREDFPYAEDDLDMLLAIAAEEEAEGATLKDFAEQLRADFLTPRETRLSSESGLQLITAQKAKGSEWQAVILPFLGRDVRPPSPRYPCFLKIPGESEPIVALNKDDFDKDNREIVTLANRQEAARLLYVATTRARHTLVLVDDSEIFLNSKNALPTNAQSRHFGDGYAAILANMSTEAKACEKTARAKSRNESDVMAATLPILTKRDQENAIKRADAFVRKISPSAYESAINSEKIGITPRNEISLRPRADNLATLYGRWWHAFFERVDWKRGLDSAQELFEEQLPTSPDPKSASKDWNATRENLFGDKNIARFVAGSATQFHREFPFSWRRNDRSVLEGFVDALMIDSATGRCLLIDWKTNKVAKSETKEFRARYQAQLAAYWKVVSEITRLEVKVGLFSTALGQLLLYSTDELQSEWQRLEQLPPSEFDTETRPDAPDDFDEQDSD
jgi:ATP-dependent exoDNAse (exonuclease V) beta subunit